jgi:GNAT superfamily N-acetyltransferase
MAASMPSLMEVRQLMAGEEVAVSRLVMRSFNAHVGHEYSPQGVAEFTRYASPEAILERAGARYLTLVGYLEGELAGMIQLRQYRHISMLFVDPVFHGRGVARSLFEAGLKSALAENPDLPSITVNSSLFAVPVYESFGFAITGLERTINGITYVPMVLEIRGSDG